MESNEIIIGIDLGTTFSAAAYVDERGRPRVIPNSEGEKTTPSVVLIENGTVEVGSAAANQAKTKSENVVQWIKRAMGDDGYLFQGLTPVEISAEILKKIKTDAEEELGVPLPKAVITCPAYFSAIEVDNTIKAGEMAGFEVKEIVKEPTAAAVYYGAENLKEGEKLLVCDLGGGTYDASLLVLENGVFQPLATTGDRQLGGHDWTSALLEYAAERLAEIYGEDPRVDPAVEQALYDTCERVKRDFARSGQGEIACFYKGESASISVTREDFEELTQWRIEQMLTWTGKVLQKTGPQLTWDQIDHILLVGGATRMRRVAEAIEKLSGIEPRQTAEADTMVALGAAILARGSFRPRRSAVEGGIKRSAQGGITRIDFARTASRNLGTRVLVNEDGQWDIRNSAVIAYNTPIPARETRKDYRTTVQGQEFFDIPVVEFDDIGADVILDTWRFRCPPGLAKDTPVHVTYEYDQSGRIVVKAVEQEAMRVLEKSPVQYEEPDLDGMPAFSNARHVVFALDVSGSMMGNRKIDRAKQALIDNARDLIDNGGGVVEVGVVAFGSRAETICQLTSDMTVIEEAVNEVTPYGTTAMGAGINLAIEMLETSDSNAQKEIVLVSDGMPDYQDQALEAGQKSSEAGINLTSLGIGSDGINESFLKDLSPNVLMIENPENLNTAIATILTQSTPPPSQPQSGITWL